MFFLTTLRPGVRASCVGVFTSLADVEEVLTEDWGDLHEAGFYTHAVIEECTRPRLYPPLIKISWWEYNNGWKKIEEPESCKHSVNFALG